MEKRARAATGRWRPRSYLGVHDEKEPEESRSAGGRVMRSVRRRRNAKGKAEGKEGKHHVPS